LLAALAPLARLAPRANDKLTLWALLALLAGRSNVTLLSALALQSTLALQSALTLQSSISTLPIPNLIEALGHLRIDGVLELNHIGAKIGHYLIASSLNHLQFAHELAAQLINDGATGIKKRVGEVVVAQSVSIC
jgi:hypothetical protein